MIGSGILLVLTTAITIGWLYVEMTDALETADRGSSTRENEGDLEI